MRRMMVVGACAAVMVMGLAAPAAAQAPLGQGAQRLFIDRCSQCHDDGDNPAPNAKAGPKPAPTLAQLRPYLPDAVFRSIVGGGSMLKHAEGWNIDDRRRVAEFVTGKRLPLAESITPAEGRCQMLAPPVEFGKLPLSNGWGVDPGNGRFQPAAQAGLPAAAIPTLTLKWAFGFPGVLQAWAQPTVAAGRVYVGTDTGVVYALDATSGCYHWAVGADASVRTGVVIGRSEFTESGSMLYFADIRANVYAVDARSGSLVWRQKIDNHLMARVTGTPVLVNDRLYVPVSGAGEEAQAGNPNYECCSFRGSVVALDAHTGTILWKAWTIAQEPRKVRTTAEGIDKYAPAGASVIGSPTVDPARGAIYVGTGNGFTDPVVDTTDAVLAFSLKDGSLLWKKQLTAGDGLASGGDVMAAPILRTLPGNRRVLVVGQKSGTVWALDPDKEGAEVWKAAVSSGAGTWGGIAWGLAADAQQVYVPVADFSPGSPAIVSPEAGSLTALRLDTGAVVWRRAATPKCAPKGVECHPGTAAPLTVTPDAVFVAGLDGRARAHAVKDGAVLWETDTARPFETVDQVGAQGGAISGAGPVVAGGMLFVSSGYSTAGVPGNVLLAYAPDPPPAPARSAPATGGARRPAAPAPRPAPAGK